MSFPPFVDKRVAIFNASPRSVHADAALARNTNYHVGAPRAPTPASRCHSQHRHHRTGYPRLGARRGHPPRARPAGFRSGANMKWIVIMLVVIVAGAVGSYWYEGYSAESELLEQPVYRVLKKHEPAVYDKAGGGIQDCSRREETTPREFHQPRQFRDQPGRHAAASRTPRRTAVLALMKDMVATARKSAEGAGRCLLPLLVSAGLGSAGYRQVHREAGAGAYTRAHGRSHPHGQRNPFAAAVARGGERQPRQASSMRPTSSTARTRR